MFPLQTVGHELIAGAVSCLGGIPFFITDSCVIIYIYICIIFPCLSFIQRRKKLLEKSLVTVGEGAMRRESVRRDSEQCTCLDLISWLQANCRNQSVPVDTNAFSFQNAYISMRSGVPSTLKCAERFHRKRSWKWIKTKTHRYRISADGRKRIKMKTMTSYVPRASSNIAGACVCNMRIVFNLRNNVQIYRFSVHSRKRIKTVVWTRIDRCAFDENENGSFWKRISMERT